MTGIAALIIGIMVTAILPIACSITLDRSKSLEDILEDSTQHEILLSALIKDQKLSRTCIDRFIMDQRVSEVLIENLFQAASKDSVLAEKVSQKLVKFPKLTLAAIDRFMPIINLDDQLCDSFCDFAVEYTRINRALVKKMEEH